MSAQCMRAAFRARAFESEMEMARIAIDGRMHVRMVEC